MSDPIADAVAAERRRAAEAVREIMERESNGRLIAFADGQAEVSAMRAFGAAIARECLAAVEAGRPLTGFFAGLTHEQQGAALAYDGPENFGDPDGPKAIPEGTVEWYELARVSEPPLEPGEFRLATAAVFCCYLCGNTIDGMGGPGHGQVCIPCGDDLKAQRLLGAVIREPST
jgi:hypothetical protein